MAEFLPLCDVLFTVISLAGYFCDVVFDLVMAWALAGSGRTLICIATLSLVTCSLVISQIVSLRWYLHTRAQREAESNKKKSLYRQLTVYLAISLHILQCGVLWRYAKLFIPVDLRHVKHEVRDLCMLRLVHAFLEAAPMLLLQVYLLICPATDLPASKPFYDLNVVSAALSLFSVCWALASFSKNVRLQNVHRLVLTWLGVIFQFLWRLGTVSARITSLTMYASLYGHWIFLVIGLHWVSMFLWLISPKNVFHGERISKPRKAYLSALIAFVYVFAYVNLQEVNHRQKMVTFYVVMLLENSLLVTAWLAGSWHDKPSNWYTVPLLVLGLFTMGLTFMLLYYRYFHVRRLGYEAGGRVSQPIGNNNYCMSCNGMCECGDNQVAPTNTKFSEIQLENAKNEQNNYEGCKVPANRFHQHAIPGVFNCRFSNPVISSSATKRKKKKPTTFVPPPTIGSLGQNLGPTPVPFWRRPLPNQHNHQGGSSENEGSSVGSRVNIHQKLQEKKQKQLAELKIIEEEIKQGKLGGPNSTNSLSPNDDIFNSLPRQPIPTTKKHVEPICWPPPSPDITDLTDLSGYSKNLNFTHNLSEMNTNNANIHKLSTYKQNLVNLTSANPNLTSLNNLNYNPINFNNASIQNITQNINSLESVSSHGPRSGGQAQNVGDLGELGGLSPILGSDDSGSLPRKLVARPLPKKCAYNARPSRCKDERGKRRERQRAANISPRNDYCDNPSPNDVANRLSTENSLGTARNAGHYQIESHRKSPRPELGSANEHSLPARISHNDISKLNVCDMRNNHVCTDARYNQIECRLAHNIQQEERNMLNASPRIHDLVALQASNELRSNSHQSNESLTPRSGDPASGATNCNQRSSAHSTESIHKLRLCNDLNVNSKLNVRCGEPRMVVCANYPVPSDVASRRLIPVEDAHAGLSPREIHNVYAEYRGNALRALPPQPPFMPYHVVPPPRTKQNVVHSAITRTQMSRSKTPEILLAPHYLDNTRIYYDWGDRGGQSNIYRIHDQHLIISNDDNNSTLQRRESTSANNEPNSVSDNENHDVPNDDSANNMYKSYRAPSDIDSQISLPRSYTLPREFKYYRRSRARKHVRSDHFIASTNSSDGDVDSGDDNDTDDSAMVSANQQQNLAAPKMNNGPTKVMLRRPYVYRNQIKHETKL